MAFYNALDKLVRRQTDGSGLELLASSSSSSGGAGLHLVQPYDYEAHLTHLALSAEEQEAASLSLPASPTLKEQNYWKKNSQSHNNNNREKNAEEQEGVNQHEVRHKGRGEKEREIGRGAWDMSWVSKSSSFMALVMSHGMAVPNEYREMTLPFQ